MAKNKMRLQIITPIKTILDQEVDYVLLSTTEGDKGVLYDHEPTVVLLGYKTVAYTVDDVKKEATTLGGFAEITKDKVVILTDAAEFAEDIDIERARQAKERAEKHLSDKDMDHMRAEIALKKAIARINLKETK